MYAIGIGFWIAFTALCTQVSPFHAFTANRALVQVIHLSAYAMAFLVLAGRSILLRPLPRYGLCALSVSFLGFFLVLGFVGGFCGSPLWLECVSVVVLAFSSACGYCQWVRLLATFEGEKPKLLLVLGSVVPILTLFVGAMHPPDEYVTVFVYGVACPLGYLSLMANTVARARQGEGASCAAVFSRTSALPSAALKTCIPSIVCAAALVLISPFGRAAYAVWMGSVPIEGLVEPFAHLSALGVISVIWFTLQRRVTLPQVYGVTLPVLGSLVLFCALVAPRFLWLVLFIGDASFFLVSLLMVATSLDIAHRFHCQVVAVYSLFAGSVYTSNVVQQLLDYLVRTGFLNGEYYLLILLLLYLLIVPAFFLVSAAVMRKDQRRDDDPHACLAEAEMGIEEACALIAGEKKLTPRQAELLVYFARGRDVAYIAEALVLSPNTVRSYRKALYAALGIHNRQQLIDAVEERLPAPRGDEGEAGLG